MLKFPFTEQKHSSFIDCTSKWSHPWQPSSWCWPPLKSSLSHWWSMVLLSLEPSQKGNCHWWKSKAVMWWDQDILTLRRSTLPGTIHRMTLGNMALSSECHFGTHLLCSTILFIWRKYCSWKAQLCCRKPALLWGAKDENIFHNTHSESLGAVIIALSLFTGSDSHQKQPQEFTHTHTRIRSNRISLPETLTNAVDIHCLYGLQKTFHGRNDALKSLGLWIVLMPIYLCWECRFLKRSIDRMQSFL